MADDTQNTEEVDTPQGPFTQAEEDKQPAAPRDFTKENGDPANDESADAAPEDDTEEDDEATQAA
jgi:hypothetical protein